MKPRLFPSLPTIPFLVFALPFTTFSLSFLQAQEIEDDFNDGDSVGWTENLPLLQVGGSGSFTFPDGGYRIQSNPSPNPDVLGPARAGAFRADANYGDFRVEVDVVAIGTANNQDVGLLARISSPGLGTLNGYSWSYDPSAGRVFLNRLDGESPNQIGSEEVSLNPDESYRFVFQGFGEELMGQVFASNDLETPLVTVSGPDDTYASGFAGIFNNSTEDDGVTDTTFDNYHSFPYSDFDHDGLPDRWETEAFGDLSSSASNDNDLDGQTNLEEFLGGSDPTDPASRSGLSRLVIEGNNLVLEFFTAPNRTYLLESSSDLGASGWIPRPDAVFSESDGLGTFTIETNGGSPLFVRLITRIE